MENHELFAGFEKRNLTFLGVTRPVWVAGDGPAVVVMHEVPGLHPAVVAFARKVVGDGFTVYMPSLFGVPGKEVGLRYTARSIGRACIAKEFTVWGSGGNSTITDWCRALARHAHHDCGGVGVGAVGMCLTGGFALGMMVDEVMMAPVLSQPSLPFAVTPTQRRDLGIDGDTLARVKARAAEGVCLMGLRFTGDRLVPAERFQRLRDELGDRFISVEIDSSWNNPNGIPLTAHSVLATHYVDQPGHPTHEAMLRVLAFFREKLQPTSPAPEAPTVE